jgi:hypothetical protein
MKTYNQLVEELCKEKGLMPHSQYPLANYDFFKEVLQRYTEQSNSHKPVVMQAEGSDVSEGAAVASSAVGKGAERGHIHKWEHEGNGVFKCYYCDSYSDE